MHYRGVTVPENIELAEKYYKKACDANISESCHNLAGLYAKSKPDLKEELKYMTKSCELGFIDSCYLAGKMYLVGSGGEKNKKKSIELFNHAAIQNYSEGFLGLGEAYAESDQKKALELFIKSCELILPSNCSLIILNICYSKS